MPKNKKAKPKITDLPTDEAIRKLFPRKVVEKVKTAVQKSKKKTHT